MKLEVFEGATRTRVNLIRTYNYVSYTEEFNGQGSFEIIIPTSESSLENLEYGNFILFEDDVVGIIKGKKDVEDSDTEITIYGYLVDTILSYRSFLKTEKVYETAGKALATFFDSLFINPSDVKRKISFLSFQQNYPTITSKETWQCTGKTYLNFLTDTLSKYNFGFKLVPNFSNYDESQVSNPNISGMELNIISPTDRTISSSTPVMFSFEMSNLERYEYEENGREYATVAIVASEGTGQERKVIEVLRENQQDQHEPTGYDRIELYIDARDIQSENTEGETLTDEELEELMIQRGNENLFEHQKFSYFDASVLQTNFKYKQDYFLGDFVTVVNKDKSKTFDLQITSVTKSISNGVEHLDIKFGDDWLEIKERK